MKIYNARPKEILNSLLKNLPLILSLAKRDLSARYQGSIFGMMWALINPVVMLVIYTFVFSVVFRARWSVTSESKTEFALLLFIGLIIFNIFAECINRAPTQIITNANYVKKVVFPLEVLSWVNLVVSLVNAGISFSVWLLGYSILFGLPPFTIFMAPVVIFPFILFIVGISWFLSAVGVFVRDLPQIVTLMVTVTMFLSPIFYPLTALPDAYRSFAEINPVALVVEQMRDVVYFGRSINWWIYGAELLGASIIAWLGFSWFQKTRKGFADVL